MINGQAVNILDVFSLCNCPVTQPLSPILQELLLIALTFRLFINVEKLSISIEFLWDTMEGWARGCCLHVFLVNIQEKQERAEI